MLEQWTKERAEVVLALRDIERLARTAGAASLADRIASDVIEKLEAGRFHLVVVGEFNHGKTTLVNALLGAEVLPVGVTPTTAVIHQLGYADEPTAVVVTEQGQRTPMPFDELGGFAAGGPRGRERIARLDVGYPARLLEGGVVLVDTPGVNDLSLTRAEITYGYIPRADAVLFVLDAGQPVKESERQFLQEQLIAKARDEIFFVVAKSDIWSDAEKEEGLEYVRRLLGGVISEPAVFAVSAEHALSEPGDDRSGVRALVEHLNHFLAERRGRVLLHNALGEGQRALGALGRGIEARRVAAELSSEQLERRIVLLEQDLDSRGEQIESRRLLIREEASSIKAWAQRDLDRFCDDMARQLKAQLERASADDVRQHLGAFLEHAFRRWAQAESAEIAAALEALAERTMALVREDAQAMGEGVEEVVGAELKTPTIEVDTFMYDVGVFAVLTFGVSALFANALLGGLMIAAAPALAVYNRDRTEMEVRKRGVEAGSAALRDAASKVGPKIAERVDGFVERLDEWVVTAEKELHREVIEVLRAAKEQRSRGQLERNEELAACGRATEELGALEARLTGLRSGANDDGS